MTSPLLSVNNLTHLYAPGKGFMDVSFDLWPGEVLGIVGESGSGKTTLLKAISARLAPQEGEVIYLDRSLYDMSEGERRRLLRTEWAWCTSIRWTACAATFLPGATSASA
ncbi:Glutathione import ATP-binding protein GsiA [Cedecea neteri]|uniref:Glutathione import ATP-binding protein GsiA n=1 Tax=Cedecea neteri TaxID=158822 RepID=A0A2X2T1A9_9ENTR|nr:Glutathione import ATP-binding protein GsiA [Cedecea neteri]